MLLALGVLLTACPAPAQVRLVAPDTGSESTMDPAPPPDTGRTGPAGIAIEPLFPHGLDNFGVLGTGRGGFGPSVWEGMTRKEVFALIEAMPVGVPSPGMNDLARRLLLSEGRLAEMAPGSGPEGGFLALRIRKAFQMGFFEGGLSEMVKRLPRRNLPPDLFLLSFRTRAVVPWDASSACELAVPQSLPDHDKTAIDLFCTLWNGESLVERSRIDALRNARGRDTLFLQAAERLAWLSNDPFPDNIHLDALGISLMQRWHLPLPRIDLDTLRPWQLNAVARSFRPGLQGLAAAEKARITGALSFSALVRIYDGIEPGPAALSLTTPEGRAAFEKQIRSRWAARGNRSPDPETVRALATGLAELRRQDSRGWLAFADCVAAITDTGLPNPAYAPDAAEIALALFGANETQRAREWADVALMDRELSPSGRRLLRVLRALADRRVGPRALGAGIFTFSDRSPPPLPPTLPVRIGRLQAAATEGHRGETALRALEVLGTAGGPLYAPADVLFSTLEALETAGLHDEARRIATEALAARGAL